MERFLRCNLGLFALVHYWNKNYVSRTFDIKKTLEAIDFNRKKDSCNTLQLMLSQVTQAQNLPKDNELLLQSFWR